MGKLSNKKKAEFRLEIEKLKMNFISEEWWFFTLYFKLFVVENFICFY
jgi:hypothetical protein